MAGETGHEQADTTVSLRDILSVRSLGLLLRAVPERVDVPVRWAHPTELTDPRRYLSGQELVLTVGTALQDERRCREFVDHLVEAAVAALGFGVGDVTEQIPPALLDACRTCGLPLVEVPAGVPFQAITQLLADRRAEAHAARGRRVQQLAARLLDAMAVDRPMDDLLHIAQAELGGRFTFWDGVLEWAPETDSDVRPAAQTMEHLTAVLAVRRHEEDVAAANRRREIGRLLELVIQGRADAEVLQHPLDSAGFGGDCPVVVAAWPRKAAELVAPRLEAAALVAEVGDASLSLSSDVSEVLKVAEALSLPCGVGEPAPLSQLRRVVPSSLMALRLSRDRGSPVTYEDLTSFEGLLEQQPAERLAPFAEKLIRPLVEHDRQHGTEFVDTLRSFLGLDASVNATARLLYLHPNSLRHRLRRVQELTGSDPRVFDERVALAVGLWAWDRRPRGQAPLHHGIGRGVEPVPVPPSDRLGEFGKRSGDPEGCHSLDPGAASRGAHSRIPDDGAGPGTTIGALGVA